MAVSKHISHINLENAVCLRGSGGDLVSTMPVCVCRKVKDMGPFLASSEVMNEKMSFKMGVKCADPLYMGRTFRMHCLK